MSIVHICTNICVWCKTSFAELDNPNHNHIGRIRNVNKPNAYLNMESTLKSGSCLCDRCWKFLEKTYKVNITKKIKEVSSNFNGSNNVGRNLEEEPNKLVKSITQLSKNFKTRNDQIFSCSVHNCKQEVDLHPLSLEECTKLNEILLKADIHTMILIKSHKWGSDERGPISLAVCEEHLKMVRVLTTCQICDNELGENLNTDYWKMYDQWNCMLSRNNISFKLLSGMFLCDTCQRFVSNNEFFSTFDLESLQQNFKKRNDVYMKLFEVPNNVNVIKRKDTVETMKSEVEYKVKFTEPLMIYNDKSCIDNHRFRKGKRTKLDGFSRSLDLLTYTTVKSNTNIEVCNSEITTSDLGNNEDELSRTVNRNIKHDNETHNATPKIEIISKKADIKEENDLLKNIEKTHQTSTKMHSRPSSPGDYHNPKSNKRIRKIISLVTKNDDLDHVKTSILPKQNEKNSPVSSTKFSANLILDSINNHSDDTFPTNKDAGTSKIDTGKDLLHIPPSQLNKDTVEVFEDEHNSSQMPQIDSVFSLLSDQTMRVASDEKPDDCTPLTISQLSVHNYKDVCNTNDEETEKCPELISQQNNSDQSENSSSSDDNYEYLSKEETIFKRVDLNEFVQCKNVLHPIRSDNLRVDPLEIKNKIHNDVCKKIKKTKKQRLNETHELYDTSPHKSDNQSNSSCIDVESSKHTISNHQIPNLPSVLSLFFKNTNENVFHCNNSDVGVQNVSHNEETIMSIDPKNTQNINSDEVEEIIMSDDQADVQNIINDDNEEIIMPNNPAGVQNIFNNERKEMIMSNDQNDIQYISSDEETIMSNYQNCMNDSSPGEPLLELESVGNLEPSLLQLNQAYLKIPHYTENNTCPINEDNIDANKTASDDEFSSDSCESKYRIIKFPRLPKVNTHSSQQNKKDNHHKLVFEVNNSNEYIYRDLLDKLGDHTAVISYLMENERLLFSGKLVISDTTNPFASDYIQKHLDALKTWYGDPEDNDLSESFISESYPEAKIYSQRLISDIPKLSKSDKTSISTCSLLSSQNFPSSPSSSDYSIGCMPEVQEEVTSTVSSCMPIMSNQAAVRSKIILPIKPLRPNPHTK